MIQYYENGTWKNAATHPAMTSENEWIRSSVTGTIPDGITRACALFIMHNGAYGTVYADCLQVEECELPRYNLLTNSDFSSGASSWTGTNLSSGDGVGTIPSGGTHPSLLGSSGFCLNGDPYADKYVSQTIAVSGD